MVRTLLPLALLLSATGCATLDPRADQCAPTGCRDLLIFDVCDSTEGPSAQSAAAPLSAMCRDPALVIAGHEILTVQTTVPGPDLAGVDLRLAPEAGERMRAHTMQRLGQSMVVMVDGQRISDGRVLSLIGEQWRMNTPTIQQARSMANRIAGREANAH